MIKSSLALQVLYHFLLNPELRQNYGGDKDHTKWTKFVRTVAFNSTVASSSWYNIF